MRKRRNGIIFLTVMIIVTFLPLTGFSWPIPDTGQKKCYDNNKEIACPKPGEPFYGQDASYTIHPQSYTKLDAEGKALPDSAKSWVMVKDNVTGLIWEVKQDDDGVINHDNLHDADHNFTWRDPSDSFSDKSEGRTDTKDFIDALNKDRFGGYTGWRIPSMKELFSLKNYGDSAAFKKYFLGMDGRFWASDAYNSSGIYGNSMWTVFFGKGMAGPAYKDGPYRSAHKAVAVRDDNLTLPHDYLVDNEDGSVTDRASSLMWQQSTAPVLYTWQQALEHCENMVLAGYTDWRMPTIKELQSLVDPKRSDPSISIIHFSDTFSEHYWSSTTHENYSGHLHFQSAAIIDFKNGRERSRNKGELSYIRAVRGGKIEEVGSDSGSGSSGGCFLSSILTK